MVQIAAVLRQVLLLKDYPATSSFKLANQHLYRRCFASPIVTKERKDLSTIHLNVEVVNDTSPCIIRLR